MEERRTPVEEYERRRYLVTHGLLLLMLALAGAFVWWRYFKETPLDYASDVEHFKYGSIGSEPDAGVPYQIWRVLPAAFPELLPDPAAFRALPEAERNGLGGYRQFGFLVEEGKDRPIGFSRRRVTIDRVGLNCAACHAGTVRVAEGMDPARIYPGGGPGFADGGRSRAVVLGMGANTVDLGGYFFFLFDCAARPWFTPEYLMERIAAVARLDPVERALYRRAVPVLRERLLLRRAQLEFFRKMPRFGPGRVDTFAAYKATLFGFAYDGTVGTADFPSIWNQRPRVGMHLHWDGNNRSVFERNVSAAIGAGATAESLDLRRMQRVAAWIGCPDPRAEEQAEAVRAARLKPVPREGELPVPRYPFAIDGPLAEAGSAVYRRECASCHDWQGGAVGEVLAIGKIGTDPHRLDSFTNEVEKRQNTLGEGQWWRLRRFRRTGGYANMPLDGVWARAPYLHNGSVPTLEDLLEPPERRPRRFFRGDDAYDPVRVGFRSDRKVSDDGRALFEFAVEREGNGNGGHVYGTWLGPAEKKALLEYLKTL